MAGPHIISGSVITEADELPVSVISMGGALAVGLPVKLVDEAGVAYGVKQIQNRPRVSSMPYGYDVAEGYIADHIPWSKVGFHPALPTGGGDIWPVGGTYVPPTAEMGMEVYSSSASDDGTPAIHSGTCTGGSATTIVDAAADFTGGTAVVAGDCVLINKAAASPEFGYVTAVAATTLTCAGGFSRGGTVAAGKTYHVIDKSASTGAQAVQICYLDDDFVNRCEIVITDGTTAVPTVLLNMYRINAWRVVAAGSTGAAVGSLDLRNTADTPIYARISAGFTRGRNSFYTVPAGKTVYITEFLLGFGYAANQTHYARLFIRAGQFENTIGDFFITPGLFYPYGEAIVANSSQLVTLDVPKSIGAGVDLKVSGVSSVTGIATSVLRGWMETV